MFPTFEQVILVASIGARSDPCDIQDLLFVWSSFVSRLRALPTEAKVETGTFQRKRGTSVKLSNSEYLIMHQTRRFIELVILFASRMLNLFSWSLHAALTCFLEAPLWSL